jgi:hypothetical protein
VKALSRPPCASTVAENSPGARFDGALEHQVFQEMGDARLSGRFIGGPDAIPDHVHDDRRAVILDHHDLQPVVEPEVRHRLGPQGQGGKGKEQGGKRADHGRPFSIRVSDSYMRGGRVQGS